MKVSNTQRLKFLGEEMKKIDAPKSMIDSMEEITEIISKKEITDQEARNVLKLVKKMQSLLG